MSGCLSKLLNLQSIVVLVVSPLVTVVSLATRLVGTVLCITYLLVLNVRGHVVGVLVISGDCRQHQRALPLLIHHVATCASEVERRLRTR